MGATIGGPSSEPGQAVQRGQQGLVLLGEAEAHDAVVVAVHDGDTITVRTSEATLLWLAFLGGSPGAYLGRRLFRHKTRKQPFCRELHRIAAMQFSTSSGDVSAN